MQKVETISKTLASKRPQEIWSRPSVKPRQYNLCDYDGLKSLNSLGSLLEVLHQGNEQNCNFICGLEQPRRSKVIWGYLQSSDLQASILRPWFDLKAT